MDRLTAELQRLFFLPNQGWPAEGSDAAGQAIDLVGADGQVRTMAISFERATDWVGVERLFQGMQEDLELPAPVVSVSATGGYRLWLSLAQPVPAGEATSFLAGLRDRYLADIPAAQVRLHPDAGGAASLDLAPALDTQTGKWSAFIDPAMGSMFVDEPGLEMAPNLDRQADLLSGFASIKAADFQRVRNALGPTQNAMDEALSSPPHPRLAVGSNFTDPKSFLLAVMNDPSAHPGLRVEAAKALLPYFEKDLPR